MPPPITMSSGANDSSRVMATAERFWRNERGVGSVRFDLRSDGRARLQDWGLTPSVCAARRDLRRTASCSAWVVALRARRAWTLAGRAAGRAVLGRIFGGSA
jgi:hypothetical protein